MSSEPYYSDDLVTLHHGDALEVLRELPDASVDAVVTDPPYGLEFMGKDWDAPWRQASGSWADRDPAEHARPELRGQTASPFLAAKVNKFAAGLPFQQWCELWATECLRVLKPGGHLLAFGGTRTWHRLACAVEDAGFEVRDSIAWMYGSGFPKSLDVSKAITGTQMGHGGNSGAIRRATMGDEYVESGRRGNRDGAGRRDTGLNAHALDLTPDAERWQGWGTALKPAFEPVVVARKPLAGTVAANVLAHGTGALNIDGCRIGTTDTLGRTNNVRDPVSASSFLVGDGSGTFNRSDEAGGRWPANVILDESQAAALDQMSGETVSKRANRGADGGIFRLHGFSSPDELAVAAANGGKCPDGRDAGETYRRYLESVENDNTRGVDDSGGASRFFYVAKADSSERPRVNGTAHPTVKPLDLMRWLVRLVTPPGGTVLEPFAGSGTTVEACLLEGFNCIAIEREDDYLPLIEARIARRRDPVKAVALAGEDGGLFDLLDGEDPK